MDLDTLLEKLGLKAEDYADDDANRHQKRSEWLPVLTAVRIRSSSLMR